VHNTAYPSRLNGGAGLSPIVISVRNVDMQPSDSESSVTLQLVQPSHISTGNLNAQFGYGINRLRLGPSSVSADPSTGTGAVIKVEGEQTLVFDMQIEGCWFYAMKTLVVKRSTGLVGH